jgi:hypothetical protein
VWAWLQARVGVATGLLDGLLLVRQRLHHRSVAYVISHRRRDELLLEALVQSRLGLQLRQVTPRRRAAHDRQLLAHHAHRA